MRKCLWKLSKLKSDWQINDSYIAWFCVLLRGSYFYNVGVKEVLLRMPQNPVESIKKFVWSHKFLNVYGK